LHHDSHRRVIPLGCLIEWVGAAFSTPRSPRVAQHKWHQRCHGRAAQCVGQLAAAQLHCGTPTARFFSQRRLSRRARGARSRRPHAHARR
jgi:hypothetical protein